VNQVSARLRRASNGYVHWCPACEEAHTIFDNWQFDGNLERPTFIPSVKITGVQTVVVDGRWTGEWVHDAAGNTVPLCCHYSLTAGVLQFHGDCTHRLKGQKAPLPELPAHMKD
jgi:hypothetical protein